VGLDIDDHVIPSSLPKTSIQSFIDINHHQSKCGPIGGQQQHNGDHNTESVHIGA